MVYALEKAYRESPVLVCACFCGGVNDPDRLSLVGLVQQLGYNYDPMFTWTAASLVATGVLLAVWAWFRDQWRRRGRPKYRCPGCDYDLRGAIEGSPFPLTCSECAATIKSQRTLTRPRRAWKLLAFSVLVFVAAHYTARGPEVRSDGWLRLMPSTLLVLQPMDVEAWVDTQLVVVPGKFRAPGAAPELELQRRLRNDRLWSWQEWILFKRVERVCRARDDYGISWAQHETADILRTTRATAPRKETAAVRLARLARSAGVPFRIDWASLGTMQLQAHDLLRPVDPHATIAGALDELCNEPWPGHAYWDISADGVVVSGGQATLRSRIYDVSALGINRSHGLAFMDLLTEDKWIINSGAFEVSNRLVVLTTSKTHIELELLLVNLRNAIEVEPPFMRPHRMLGNVRSFKLESDYYLGLLDHIRAARSVSIESLRSLGPTFDDGMTEDELDAYGRVAFGLLDTLR